MFQKYFFTSNIYNILVVLCLFNTINVRLLKYLYYSDTSSSQKYYHDDILLFAAKFIEVNIC